MSTDLPGIPDEAWRAVDSRRHIGMDAALRAAWPHLYAAALRDAADRIVAESLNHGGLSRTVAQGVGAGLRRMADEVTP